MSTPGRAVVAEPTAGQQTEGTVLWPSGQITYACPIIATALTTSSGSITVATDANLNLFGTGHFVVPKTITGGGTTGSQTINKMSGSVNFAAAAQTLAITNSLVASTSVVLVTVATDDTTAKSCIATPSSGSILLKLNAAATGEVKVFFNVTN